MAAVSDSGASGVSIRSSVGAQAYLLERYFSTSGTHMTAYRVEQPGRPQPATRRVSCHIPEGIPIASPTISRAPPVTPASSEPSTSQLSQGWPFHFRVQRVMPLTADPDRISERTLLRDGSYSSMPGADVDHPGSAHCHLEVALGISVFLQFAKHLTPTAVPHTRRPQSLRPLLKQLLKR
ncbi:hypothetical protein CK203_017900 [Vitis vinifera]|uniref:Uncharacterized protein n=1 Tax=Vitis vinifera TaxID=29760 RepID=A0A438JVW5_VITVI|nr:hypothetical protein CK203_017900 [Vitis vinifera]